MTTAACPGSFDPITLGHLDIVERAACLFDGVIVAIAANPAKPGLLTPAHRAELAREATAALPAVRVEIVEGLLAPWCAAHGVDVIVRGVRSGTDFAFEEPMALMNRQLGGPDTILIPAAPAVRHISASLVRDIAAHGGDVTAFVPPAVAVALADLSGDPRA